MKFRRILISLAAGLLLCPAFAQAGPKVRFSMVYTNDVMGEVEPCG